MKAEVEVTEGEDHCLQDFRKELDYLMSEKNAHVEELRQIHADINAMEAVIKQSEEDRNRHLDTAKMLNRQFLPLKEQVDKMREEIGLPRLPELHEEDEKFKPEFFEKATVSDWTHHHSVSDPFPESPLHSSLPTPSHPSASSLIAAQQQMQHLAAVAAAQRAAVKPPFGSSIHHQQHSQPPPHHPQQGMGPMASGGGGPVGERPSSTAFRQQPPPMKSCLSCHQQIHRNAPICPLCKAKSRSRNPKKPKRKHE